MHAIIHIDHDSAAHNTLYSLFTITCRHFFRERSSQAHIFGFIVPS